MDKYYLGADVSKGYADFIILDSDKKEVEPNFQLDDTFDGHCKLYEIIENFLHEHPGCTLYTGVESTGGYEDNWFHFLLNCSLCFDIQVARLNPFGVSKNNQAGMKRNKTDKISARDVAEYLITHPENVTYQRYDPLSPLKEQWNYINLLNKQKVQLLNVLEKNTYKANPELLVYCRNGVPQWVLKVLAQFPTAKLLAQAEPEELVKIQYVSYRKALNIIERARKSVASASDSVTEQRIRDLVEEISDKSKKIEKQKELLERNTKIASGQIKLLKSFKGIGSYSAVGLLIVIKDVNNFSNVKKLASFFGIHPVFKQSGDGSWGFHMSKQGSSIGRQILFMITLPALRCNPLIKEIYEKNLEKGMKKMAAIGVCMHKILRIIYGMLKNNTPFDPEIDRKNRLKQNSRSKRVNKNRSRRHQSHDDSAPISRRQAKKRKNQIEHQKVNIIHSEKLIPNLDDIHLN